MLFLTPKEYELLALEVFHHKCMYFKWSLLGVDWRAGNQMIFTEKSRRERNTYRHQARSGNYYCIITNHYYYIYIYAFSRCFYPKRLTIAFRLYIFNQYFNQYVCSLGIKPTTFCAANAMLYHWATLYTHYILQNKSKITILTLINIITINISYFLSNALSYTHLI